MSRYPSKLFIALASAGSGALCAAPMAVGVPLPSDLAITTQPLTQPDLARWIGGWGNGAWNGTLATALVIESVTPDGRVRVVYAWGSSGATPGGFIRTTAVTEGNSLHFEIPNGPRLHFRLVTAETLLGTWQRGDAPPAVVSLHRIGTDVAAIRAAAASPVPLPWEELSIPECSENGHSVRLQATFYPPLHGGREPLIIFNHGSTGGGKWPARTVDRGWTVAPVFQSLGCSIVIPMRRGRGSSDGDLAEESRSLTPAAQLDRALADLQATVEYMRKRADVDPSRIILAGQSRGGLLSLAYAARHPNDIAGVINFAGGWYSDGKTHSQFDYDEITGAGKLLRVPTLWLYANHDSYYALRDTERLFATFRHAGGTGKLEEIRDLKGDGHLLFAWPDAWQSAVTRYVDERFGESNPM